MIRKWGVSSPKMTQSSPVAAAVEMREIKQRLQEDGLDPACSDHERILHLWQLYMKSEASLKASLESIDELRKQQTEEMQEVENYVEHIRTLTNEREQLTAEFEAENEALKAEIERLHKEVEELDNRDEIYEMLVQQGLEDIAVGTISEQIAYLLVERARLMDELEAEQAKGNVDTPEGAMTAQQVYSILEQERQDYEEELQQQRDTLNDVKMKMLENQEEEINGMMAENQKLQDLLDQERKKIGSSSQEMVELADKGTPIDPVALVSSSTPTRLQELEADNSTLQENLKTLSAELQNVQGHVAEFEDLAVTNGRKSEHLQSVIERLKQEKEELRERVRLAESHRNEAPQNQNNERTVFAEMAEEAQSSVKTQVESLKTEKNSLSDELNNAKADLNRLKEKLKLLDPDEDGAEFEETKSKIRKLEQQIQDIEGDLGRVQRELWSKQNEFKKDSESVMARLENQLKEANSRIEEISSQKRSTENELRSLAEEKGTLMERIASSETKVKELETRGLELEEEIAKLKKTTEQHQIDASLLNDQMNRLVLEKYEVERKLLEVTEEKFFLEKQLNEAKNKITDLEEKERDLEAEIVSLKSTSDEYQGKLGEAKKECLKLSSEKQDIERWLLGVSQEKWFLQEQEKRLSCCVNELRERVQRAEGDLIWWRNCAEEYQTKCKETDEELEKVSWAKQDLVKEFKKVCKENQMLIEKFSASLEDIARLERMRQENEIESLDLKSWNEELSTVIQSLEGKTIEKDDLLEQTILKLQTSEQEKEAGDRRISNYEDDMENYEKQIRTLQSKLDEKDFSIRQMSTDFKAEKLKVESMQSEASSSRNIQKMEIAALNNQMECLQAENKQLKTKLYEDEEEILQIKRDNVQLKGSQSKLQVQVKELEGRVMDGEQVRADLGEELLKCRGQIRDLKNEVESLEMDNNNLSAQLERRTSALSDIESQMKSFSSSQDVRNQNLQKRAEEAEERLHKLQEELLEKTSQMNKTEKKLKDFEEIKLDLQEKEDELNRLRTQLQMERAKGSQEKDLESSLAKEIEKLQSRESELQRRNNELQHMLLDVQTKLEVMRENAKMSSNQSHLHNQSSSAEQVVQLRQEVEALQIQLAQINNMYDSQINKYTDRKLRTKNKLHKAREHFSQERMKYTGVIERLQNELAIVKSTLARETEWKTQVEENYRKLLLEKRDLMSQMSEQEESLRDQTRSVAVLQVRSRYLEDENNNLQMRVDSLTKQKHNLDKLLRDLQTDKNRQELDQTINSDLSAFSPRPNGKDFMGGSFIDEQNHLV